MFSVRKKSKKSDARLGVIITPHGKIQTPFFMPIATRGAVKHLQAEDMKELGAEILLSNTYHLSIRPGMKIMKKCKGLHSFMNWHGPVLTDSGGFQVFSLARSRKISNSGVHFVDPVIGEKIFLSPEKVIEIQKVIGSDIMMVLDECPAYPCPKSYAEQSLELTTKWAKKSKTFFDKKFAGIPKKKRPLIFAIVQGSNYESLRKRSAQDLISLDFDGYAIGGVAVGEPREMMKKILEWTIPELPESKPRYLMGLGKPHEILDAVISGVDMFDCVIPTREARHGRLYYFTTKHIYRNKKNFYSTINILNKKFSKDLSSVNSEILAGYSKAYLHHLFKTKESLGQRLASIHNLHFYLQLMKMLRENITRGKI